MVTVDAPDEHVAVADMPPAGLTSLAVLLDDDGMEQVEYEGQTLEIHGLSVHQDTEASIPEGLSVEGARKRRRTQGVGTTCSLRGPN